jgi:hypothetical protein
MDDYMHIAPVNANKTATNGMTSVTHLKNNTGNSFTLLTCPVRKERSVHLSFRTFQHTRATHIQCCPRSTPGNFVFGSFTVNFPANRVRNATVFGSVKQRISPINQADKENHSGYVHLFKLWCRATGSMLQQRIS